MNQKGKYLIILGLLAACTPNDEKKPSVNSALFTKIESEYSGIDFVNKIENQKNFNVFKYRNFYNGGGVAIGDVNNDGLADIYFTGNMEPNKLYLNKGNFKFEDITEKAGVAGNKPWSTGVAMVDINDDGLLDIYVSNAGNMEGNNHDNDLYINNGDLTFTERAADFNLAKSGFSTHAAFFDYDKDGDLDAYLLNNSNIPVSGLGYAADREKRASDWEDVPEIFRGVGDVLLRNDNGTYVDVSEEAGIYGSLIGFGLGVYVCDINEDTYPDIYVSNDFYERDYLYINQKDGTFSEDIRKWTSHLCLSAMGVDMGDVNNDGLNDIFITDMMPEKEERIKSVMEFENYNVFKLKQSRDFYQQYIQNTLQINNGNGTFSEVAYFSGIAKTDWSWAGLVFDMDNDGFKDIYVTNGIIHDLTDIDFVDFFANEVIQNTVLTGEKEEITEIIEKMPVVKLSNYAYRNTRDLRFDNATSSWGLEIPSFSNGCAYADLDNDGDLDLVVNNVNMESFLFKNNAMEINHPNYLKMEFEGLKGNRNAIGTRVKLYAGETTILQELMPFRGFQSSVEYPITVGLGDISKIDSIRVIWPDGNLTVLKNVAVNQKLKISQKDAGSYYPENLKIEKPLMTEVKAELEMHIEDLYNDFNHEGMLDKHLSKEGPALAIGDVNADGNTDFYLGGAKGQAGALYLNLGNGIIKKLSNRWFDIDAGFEDTAASLFDADGDGDLDLMVGTGGNSSVDKKYYVTRLYMNNGKGEFTRSESAIPSLEMNTSVIAPVDFDEDGDVDVFIGSRNVPGVYGIDPGHLLLQNDGKGNFSDVTERLAYDLKNAGMITDASWADIDGDGKKDLITVADWGTPQVYKNNGRRLTPLMTNLSEYSGWWGELEVDDLDNDGDMDLVIGNKGLNIPYVGTKEAPVKLWINDFDKNGTIEQITTTHYSDNDYPIHMRKEMSVQMPFLKKENLKASDYAKRTVQELFDPQVMQSTIVKTVNYSESVVAINNGDGKFELISLPQRVQWSCMCGITCTDVNNDQKMDIILAGNRFEFKPQYSRQDSNFGNVLLGDGKNHFEWVNYANSGFFVRDEVRDLGLLTDMDGKRFLITATNNSEPRLFQFNQ